MVKTKEVVKKIEIQAINKKEVTVQIVGKTPLLMDRFPEAVKDAILAKQTGLAKAGKKTVRNTKKETIEAIHVTNKGKTGFPAAGFKKAMMGVTSFVGDKFFSKKLVMGLQIVNTEDGLILIKSRKQDVLQHNIGHNVKFSPQFHDWSCELKIQYDANNIGADDIVTLLDYAGFYCGVGAWRPCCKDGGTGNFGMFEVKKDKAKA